MLHAWILAEGETRRYPERGALTPAQGSSNFQPCETRRRYGIIITITIRPRRVEWRGCFVPDRSQ
jgi:hypothetical protein